jgi:tRNA/rRNA methyltransferase
MTASTPLQLATRFLLLETIQNGNVGSAARAMKTMGFHDLVLVRPADPRVLGRAQTKQHASGAMDVLRTARIVETLQDGLIDVDHIIGTRMPHPMKPLGEQHTMAATMTPVLVAPRPYFADYLQNMRQEEKEKIKRIAFVFGCEKYGLKPEDLAVCHVHMGIPSNPSFGSLNLACAVQVIAYDWREAIGGYNLV